MVPRRTWLVNLTALIAGFAGCTIPGDPNRGGREPYGVEEPLDSSIPDGIDNIPGLSEAGIESAAALVENHNDAMHGRAHTERVTIEVREGKTVIAGRQQWTRNVDEAGTVSIVSTPPADGDGRSVEYWNDGDVRVSRIEIGPGEYRYEARPEPGWIVDVTLAEYLDGVAMATVDAIDSAEETFRVVAGGVDPDGPFLVEEAFTMMMTIREDGRIVTLLIDGTVETDEGRFGLQTQYVTSELLRSPLEAPSWYEEAIDELGIDGS